MAEHKLLDGKRVLAVDDEQDVDRTFIRGGQGAAGITAV